MNKSKSGVSRSALTACGQLVALLALSTLGCSNASNAAANSTGGVSGSGEHPSPVERAAPGKPAAAVAVRALVVTLQPRAAKPDNDSSFRRPDYSHGRPSRDNDSSFRRSVVWWPTRLRWPAFLRRSTRFERPAVDGWRPKLGRGYDWNRRRHAATGGKLETGGQTVGTGGAMSAGGAGGSAADAAVRDASGSSRDSSGTNNDASQGHDTAITPGYDAKVDPSTLPP